MEKITKSMTIGLTEDNQAAVSITPNTTLTEALQLLGTLATHILSAYTKVAIEQLNAEPNLSPTDRPIAVKGIQDSIYDACDTLFSNILHTYQPEHPRYTLEDEAIIELVNQKIQLQYEQLTPEQQKTYKDSYLKVKYRLKEQMSQNAKSK